MDFKYESDRIYLENEHGSTIAEVCFSHISDNEINIYHTYVDKSLRGQGVADKLITALVYELKKNSKKAYVTCSYTLDWFEKHPEYSDIYTK